MVAFTMRFLTLNISQLVVLGGERSSERGVSPTDVDICCLYALRRALVLPGTGRSSGARLVAVLSRLK